MSEWVIIGAAGMVGRAWVEHLEEAAIPFVALDRAKLDLSEEETIEAALKQYDAKVVVNCAAYTDVDGAESDEEKATLVNGHGVAALVTQCDALGIALIHYSTDYVFSGDASAPYAFDHPIAPLNAYGRSKRVGEQAILSSPNAHLLIRTSWVYAPWGNNFVKTIARLAADRPELKVVDDQRGRPTSAQGLVESSRQLYEAGARGAHHVTDGGECSWFEFATEIAAQINPECRVAPCGSDEYPRPAPRPAYSVLDIAPSESAAGHTFVPWKTAVEKVLALL